VDNKVKQPSGLLPSWFVGHRKIDELYIFSNVCTGHVNAFVIVAIVSHISAFKP
jgi:hypothetical protein